jgi:hypothetical protein
MAQGRVSRKRDAGPRASGRGRAERARNPFARSASRGRTPARVGHVSRRFRCARCDPWCDAHERDVGHPKEPRPRTARGPLERM